MTQRNIVLVTYDSLRADHCGHLGYDRKTTPNLDAMADDGISFTNAISPASRTNPSMAGVFTGEPLVTRERVSNPEVARRHLDRFGTLAEALSEQGYTTGAFNPNAYASRYYGFNRGFDHFEDFLFSSDRYQSVFERHLSDSSLYTLFRNLRNFVRREEAFKTWDSYVDDVEQWVRSQDEPFFLWLFAMDTHFPHLTPRSHRQWSSLFDQYYYNWRCNQLIDELDVDLSERERQKIVDIYDDSVRFGDALLGELRERLDDFDPVFVVHGDHGEAFGERDVYGHFYPALYEEHIHVPWVVSGVDRTDEIKRPASLLDLPDVVRQAAGDEVTYSGRDWAIATDYDGRFDRNLTAVRLQEWTYLRAESDGATSAELYDLTDSEYDDRRGENLPIEAALSNLCTRRLAHEAEQLAIQEYSQGQTS